MPASAVILVFPLVLLSSVLGFPRQVPGKSVMSDPSQETLFVDCQEKEKSKQVVSPVSLSEDGKWRAYVEVDVQSELGCLHTTRLWVARPNAPYRLLYLIPPNRTAVENGMEILGWAKHSSMLLVKSEEWQHGSDAPDRQQVLAIDAGTGMVYEPELEAMIKARREKQCFFRVVDAGFGADKSVNILVRAKFSTAIDVDETEENVPPAKRCGNAEETWSFNFGTGDITQVANTQPLQIVKKYLRDQRNNN
jgi:hypothetical protein